MVSTGTLPAARSIGADGHLCWSYPDPAAPRRSASAVLAEGRAAGGRLRPVGDGLGTISGLSAVPTSDICRCDPADQVAVHAAATSAAPAAGYTVPRVVAEVTRPVRTAAFATCRVETR